MSPEPRCSVPVSGGSDLDGSFWVRCPDFADVFVGREAARGLETTREVVRIQEVREVAELIVAVVVIPFDCRLLDRTVHPFDLTVRPWMLGLEGDVRYHWLRGSDQTASCET